MHGMNWGGHPHKRYSGAGMEVDVPLIPAPVAVMTMIVGMAIGVMIGHKKAMMHCGQPGMMGGMGHGMMGGGMGAGYGGDWMKRKKAMMQGMGGHHHHSYGAGPCFCGVQSKSADMPEGAEEEERPGE